MSNVNNQFKELINGAIHNHFHDDTETEMILKDWLYGICEQLDEYDQHKVATTILVNTLKSKADEYEAKAGAFDAIMREWEDERMTKSHILETIQKYYDEYESGEPYAKK